MGVIYSLRFPGSKNRYVGSARHRGRRMASHLHLLRQGRHHCRALQNAANKHGMESLIIETLEDVVADVDLLPAEQRWLDHFKGTLYNKSPTAESRLGATMSPEARAKISASLQGNQYRKGKPFPPEHRAIISAAVKAAYADGRRKPTPTPQNLAAHNAAVQRGEKIHPSVRLERDAQIVEHFAKSGSKEATGRQFGLTGSAIGYAVRRHTKRSERCTNKVT